MHKRPSLIVFLAKADYCAGRRYRENNGKSSTHLCILIPWMENDGERFSGETKGRVGGKNEASSGVQLRDGKLSIAVDNFREIKCGKVKSLHVYKEEILKEILK